MTVLVYALAALSGVLLLVAVFCLVMNFRWKNRNDPIWNPLLDPEPDMARPPLSQERREAARLIRDGAAAGNPETAHVVCRLSRNILLQLSNPWETTGWVAMLLGQGIALGLTLRTLAEHPLAIVLGGTLCVLLAGMVTVWIPLARRRARSRAERALALNRDLAAAYTIGKE